MLPEHKTWLEVALNGPWGKRRHADLPVTVAEIVADGIACVEAGASILHVHPYDEATGRQKNDWQIYARIIEGIKAKVDAIIYPTIPTTNEANESNESSESSGRGRFAVVEELAKRGLLEWAAIDPGSVNLTYLESIARHKPGFLYQNPDADILSAMALAEAFRLHASYAIYEPGFARAGAAFERAFPEAPKAIYRFMFSNGYSFGFPPKSFGLQAYLSLLGDMAVDGPWMIAGLLVSIEPLIEETVHNGGHIRVGLEDAPRDDERNNLQWVNFATARINAAGGQVASVTDVRGALAP